MLKILCLAMPLFRVVADKLLLTLVGGKQCRAWSEYVTDGLCVHCLQCRNVGILAAVFVSICGSWKILSGKVCSKHNIKSMCNLVLKSCMSKSHKLKVVLMSCWYISCSYYKSVLTIFQQAADGNKEITDTDITGKSSLEAPKWKSSTSTEQWPSLQGINL